MRLKVRANQSNRTNVTITVP